ncbi:MAG: DEAD/DEAH box helicase [bacterium]
MSNNKSVVEFDSLNLPEPIARAVKDLGYEAPSPIQAEAIPPLLEGRDILGQAQTGTGKTAAFALPILSHIDLSKKAVQVLVLAPTRELAIQVSEAFQSYARHLKGFHVLPIYGGQSYSLQLKPLKRGVHVVVGTPGRVMDHMRKGTLELDNINTIVLDEADEMLRMGFIDDVKWVLEQMPSKCQMALFSATMPRQVQNVAEKHLENPAIIKIASKTSTATTINQRYWQVAGVRKLDALTRIFEVEEFDGVIVFVRTKSSTEDIAERLSARGFAAAALNGDVPQKQRERTVESLKKGRLDILVATDVAARGLDVERISHVINFDIPYDTEAYVHRIGRTGRAGRQGEAILFVSHRERRMLNSIERATGKKIEPMSLPSWADVKEVRLKKLKEKILDTLASEDLSMHQAMLDVMAEETDVEMSRIAAALAFMVQGGQKTPKEVKEEPKRRSDWREGDRGRRERPGRDRESRGRDNRRERQTGRESHFEKEFSPTPLALKGHPDVPMERFVIDVGHSDGVKPGNIVGAIANEAELDSAYIGHIEIHDNFSTVDLPEGMPKETFNDLKKVWVCQNKLNIRKAGDTPPDGSKPSNEGVKKNRSFKKKTGFDRSGKLHANRRKGSDGKREGRSNMKPAPRKRR